MTEQEFRKYLQEHAEEIGRVSGRKLTPELIEQMVQGVQETKRLLASGALKKEDLRGW